MKIWLDVSGLAHWQGNFTGIQRVNFNIAEELDNSGLDYGLFVYHGVFTELKFSDLKAGLEQRKQTKTTISKEPFISKLKPQKVLYYTLVTSKKVARGLSIEPQLRGTYNTIRSLYRNARSLPAHVIKPLFSKDDVVVVVDGNWQFYGYAEKIIADKQKIDFKLVHVVQDLIAYNNPALANKGANKIIGSYFKKIFKVADALPAISESTKHDIEWFLEVNNISNKPILPTITLGTDIRLTNGQRTLSPKINIPKEFILSVSTIEIRKNYLLFYYVYNLAFQKGIKLPHLVIVGRKGWMAEEAFTLLTEDPKINKNITICTSIKDTELAWLYQNCLYTVFPSFYEGWGLPVAESLNYGKCCISSDTSSMTEVGKEFCIYASPYDPSAFLEQMLRLTDGKLRSQLEADIRDKYKPTSWRDTFDQLTKIINDLY